jgi:hypothetical protein
MKKIYAKATKKFPYPELFLLQRDKIYEVIEDNDPEKMKKRILILDDKGMILQFPKRFFKKL